jgi:hypothetical protein
VRQRGDVLGVSVWAVRRGGEGEGGGLAGVPYSQLVASP